MAKAFGANRLRPTHLRVLDGGMRAPVEKIDVRVTERRKAATLMRAAIPVLVLALALSAALVALLFFNIEDTVQIAWLLAAGSAAAVGVGAVLVGGAFRLLRHIEHYPARIADRSWSSGESRAG